MNITEKINLGRQLVDEVQSERPCCECVEWQPQCQKCAIYGGCGIWHQKFSPRPQIEAGDIVRLKKNTSCGIFVVFASGDTLSVLMCIHPVGIYEIGDKGTFETSKIEIVLKKDKIKEL